MTGIRCGCSCSRAKFLEVGRGAKSIVACSFGLVSKLFMAIHLLFYYELL